MPIRLERAADQVQQGRFAGAVAADEPDLGSIGDLRARLVDKGSPRDAVGQTGKGQHPQSWIALSLTFPRRRPLPLLPEERRGAFAADWGT